MNNPLKTFKVVPFQPDNLSIGNALTHENATIITEESWIASTLSLYFQWEEYRSAAIVKSGSNVASVPIELDYDRDESSISEIRIHADTSELRLEVFATLLIRFEVFRTCYEFEAAIIAVSQDPKNDGYTAIVTPPDSLKVRKYRRLPRKALSIHDTNLLPMAKWIGKREESQNQQIQITEVGATSIRFTCPLQSIDNEGQIKIGDHAFDAVVIRNDSIGIVVGLQFKNTADFGRYFDLYRKIAYPSLRSRYEYPHEESLQVYSQSTYFGKYEHEKPESERNLIKETWDRIQCGFHETFAAYFITNRESKPVGTSTTTLATFDDKIPVWFFHELCAIKVPELVAESGVLYTWRAEYLAARPEPLSAAVCFHSKSRWVERMYVKHAMASRTLQDLYPIKMIRHSVNASTSNEVSLVQYKIGNERRVSTQSSDIWGAAGPTYLNANESLNTIIALFKPVTRESILALGAQLAAKLDNPSIDFLTAVPHDYDASQFEGKAHIADRFYRFQKEELVNLIASIEHSVAATKRKLEHRGSL